MQANVFCITKDISRDEWLEKRRHGIGGSDAAIIMGVSPFSSLMDLWLDKTGQFEANEDDASEAMYWGNVLEDVVAREFTERTGKRVRRRNAILQHPDYPYMFANVDRLVLGEKAGLEVKTTNAFYQDEGQCPPLYYSQVQHYMAVTGYKKWYVAVLAGGQRFYIYTVHRSEDYINELIAAEAEFWQMVQEERPPAFDGSAASTRLLNQLYPEATEEEKELPADAYLQVQLYEDAAEEEKAAKERKDEAANKLKDMLGEAAKGFIFDRKISWANVTSKRFDTKRFKKENPDLHDQYINESTYRRFSIK